MWFDFGRSEGLPTQYPEVRTAVTADVLEAGFLTAYAVLLISFLVSIARSNKIDTLWATLRVIISLTIGLFIMRKS